MNLEFPTTAEALGQSIGASVIGDGGVEIHRLAPLEQASEGSLSFFASRKYSAYLSRIKGAVVLTSEDLVRPELPLTFLVVAEPKRAFAQVAQSLVPTPHWEGISSQAVIHPSAILGERVAVGPYAVISQGVKLGARTIIFPHAYVGVGTEIGEQCHIYPHVCVLDGLTIGNRVRIFPGAVIGSEGFGFVEGTDGHRTEVPQLGTVVIEDEVRVGAHVTIDRATLGETRIGFGTKIDDHVHIGHNCRIGKNCILCGQVGLSGSVVLEDNVILAGQVGVGDHVVVGKGAIMAAQSGTSVDLKSGESYFLSPAVPSKEAFRIIRHWRKLPELWEKVKRLEEQLKGKS